MALIAAPSKAGGVPNRDSDRDTETLHRASAPPYTATILAETETMPALEPLEIDRLLETLTGVVRARVRLSPEGDSLDEIHILSDGAAAPKQIVRNIETLLQTAFNLQIDHRVVSIAVLKEGAEMRPEEVVAPQPPPYTPPQRVVFQRLRMVQDEPYKCTAYVELKLGDVIFEGSHRDTDTPRARLYASARAVIEALEYLTEKEIALYLAGLESVRVFQRQVLIVLVEGRRHRQQMRMMGTSVIEDDPHEAAVRAVLDAVNRFITRPNGNRGAARI